VGGQRHAPAALTPGETRYPLYRWLGGPQGRSGRVRKISPQPGFDPRTAQPVASRYTDCAIPAHTKINVHIITGNYLVPKRKKKSKQFKKEGFTKDSKNPGARRVTSCKFHTEGPQLLGTTIQSLVVRATWFPDFVHPCNKQMCTNRPHFLLT